MFAKPRKVYPDLKAKREKLGLTRAQFARFVGVSEATIKNAEIGMTLSQDSYKWIDEALNG